VFGYCYPEIADLRHAYAVAYPEGLLADDEKVVEHLHPHWITLFLPVLEGVVTLAVGTTLAILVPHWSAQGWLRLAVAVLTLAVVCWLTIGPYVRWRGTHYVLTTHRLMIRTGVFNHRGRDIPLQRINNALYEQTLWERMINSGSLTVESAGEDGKETFQHIPRADRTQQLINRLTEEDQDRRQRTGARYEAQYEVEYEDEIRHQRAADADEDPQDHHHSRQGDHDPDR